uniref:Uncharacterized protein n=1 Tax=Anguilla anguilla TaxID=7936 RepID=A0A0E9U0U5_ANGAN
MYNTSFSHISCYIILYSQFCYCHE